ncbi:MAG TPA: multiheme c-type cytochrome [Candidatus Eisenbacteria bacterium]|nr:multiheme c-type cytochrome [Candidatus Eisenbacteria bacterium]
MTAADPRRRAVATVARAVLVAAALLASATGREAAASPGSSSRLCGACHGPLRTQWAGSAHATSWTNPVFQAFLADAKEKQGAAIQATCLPCHAPLAHVSKDLQVSDPVAKEGVGCNFCHNVSAVDPSTKPGSYTFDPSNPNLMRGPYRDADPAGAHEAVYSEIHTKPEFCASCHSAVNPTSGLLIEGTYLAWKRSGGAEYDMTCQECHMPPAPGKAATVATKTRPAVNAHTFVGPRSTPAWLDDAANLKGSLDGGRLRLEVENAKAGHSLPGGGNSMRTISLDVVFTNAAGAEVKKIQAERFGTEFADAKGASPVPKWAGRSVVRSTEIGPDSSRVVLCDVPPGATRANATLTYHSIHPAYRAMLAKRGVDLSGRAPVVLARTTVVIP